MRCHRLDLNLLLVLDLLLKTRNLSRVAEALNVTQSAISNALARLRTHFNDELLIQSGREMVASPLALQMAESIEELVARGRAIALTRAGFDAGTSEQSFSVVASDYTASLLFAELVKRVESVAPRICISQIPIPDFRQRAFNGFDVLIGSNVVSDDAVYTTPLWEEQFVPVVWSGNTDVPEKVSLATIETFAYVSAAPDERLSVHIVDHFLKSQGIQRAKLICLQSWILLPEFLVETPYMAILPLRLALCRARQLPLRILETDFEFPRITEMLQWPIYLDRDPANIWLRNLVQATAAHVDAQCVRTCSSPGRGLKRSR